MRNAFLYSPTFTFVTNKIQEGRNILCLLENTKNRKLLLCYDYQNIYSLLSHNHYIIKPCKFCTSVVLYNMGFGQHNLAACFLRLNRLEEILLASFPIPPDNSTH